MRYSLVLLLGVLSATNLRAADPPKIESAKRFGVAADLKTYPQGTEKETFASVLKAIDDKRFDYLVAQLADPRFIDDRVKRIYGGKFEEQVEDTRSQLDPAAVQLLHRIAKEAKEEDWTVWTTGLEKTVSLKDVRGRAVTFVNISGRWYMYHGYQLSVFPPPD